MWTPLITVGVLVLLALTAAAGWTALFACDHDRAQRATTVLKIVLCAALGSGGLVTALIHLHQAGLL